MPFADEGLSSTADYHRKVRRGLGHFTLKYRPRFPLHHDGVDDTRLVLVKSNASTLVHRRPKDCVCTRHIYPLMPSGDRCRVIMLKPGFLLADSQQKLETCPPLCRMFDLG